MKRVITYGTFDLLHYGHINLLKRAKEYGDYLIVALSTDEFNWDEKRKKCYFTYEQRKKLLEAFSPLPFPDPDRWYPPLFRGYQTTAVHCRPNPRLKAHQWKLPF